MKEPTAGIIAMSHKETRLALRSHGLDSPAGFGFAVRRPQVNTVYDWHQHTYHQLMFAISGPSHVETDKSRRLIPQGQAVWIPAGTPHRSLIIGKDGGSLFFDPNTTHGPDEISVLAAGSILREMVMLAMRWPVHPGQMPLLAESVFKALALLCAEWSNQTTVQSLRTSRHPRLQRAMDYALADIAAASQEKAAQAAALSSRTLRRLFEKETGEGWNEWVRSARITIATGMLQEGHRVTDVADEVGYASLSAFAKAFSTATGESPLRYQRKLLVG